MSSQKRQTGFTLIEVMIAVLIFSIGLMGMAALMVISVKTNQSAYLRTQASFLAQGFSDRMRANMSQIPAYNGTYDSSTVAADPCTGGIACSPAQVVVRDRGLWSQQLINTLPNPTATVACNGGLLGFAGQPTTPYAGLCTLTIQWDEATLSRGTLAAAPGNAAANLQTFAWVFQP